MLTDASYTPAGFVRATIDGVPVEMPADHPFVLAHIADGGSVAPVPPPSTAALIVAVKAEARRRILLVASEDRQRNLTARAVELALTYPGQDFDSLPEPEKTEAAAGLAIWAAIKALRAASNAIEATIAGMSPTERAAFDATDDQHWA